MPKTRSLIPDPLRRRILLEEPLETARALAVAEAYLAEERVWEAVDFLRKADARERLHELRERAIASGDPFLLRQVSVALGEEPGRERWRALAQAARDAGKLVAARDAERMEQLPDGGV